MSEKSIFPAMQLQMEPGIYIAIIPGDWLLKHARPSWRIKNPIKGFQRVVKEERARQIALTVLDQQRTFPNSIILATNVKSFELQGNSINLKKAQKFLLIDGQHRLYAQHFSGFIAQYACVIHCGLNKVEMAKLFLEINDTQKKVPASLRWDLVRLVKPENDEYAIRAADLVYELTNETDSPLHRRVDLTGEQPDITLNQASIAPEIKYISTKNGPFKNAAFEEQYSVLVAYLTAIKSLDNTGWEKGESFYYRARILRALIRLLADILDDLNEENITKFGPNDFSKYLKRIDIKSLDNEQLRAKQGSAGIKQIYSEIKSQIL